MSGWKCRVRTRARHSLSRRPWPLPSNRTIPVVWQNLDPKFYVPQWLDTVHPTRRLQLAFWRSLPQTAGHPHRECYSSAIATETGVFRPGVQCSTNRAMGWTTGQLLPIFCALGHISSHPAFFIQCHHASTCIVPRLYDHGSLGVSDWLLEVICAEMWSWNQHCEILPCRS